MELILVKDVFLSDGNKYTGWGYYEDFKFIPHGCGKKFFNGYYALGNFRNGNIDGPAIISHDYFMYTMQFENNRGNGWGLCINSGILNEFGYYENSQLKENLSDFVIWYFKKIQDSGRRDNMLNLYSFNDTHEVSDLLIGFKGTSTLCFMGFHFLPDGSVWVGNTETRKFSGNLVHFCADGTIECGLFDEGNLIEPMELQSLIDNYYGTFSFDEDDIFSDLFGNAQSERNQIREQFRNIDSIKSNYNYFLGKPIAMNNNSLNKYQMIYHVLEADMSASGNFESIVEEIWTIGDRFIISPHGNLEIQNAIFVDKGSLVGVQFSVSGTLNIADFRCANGIKNTINVATLAIMRQPHNAWLWVYMFDDNDSPVANFCGFDDLDGFANFVSLLKSVY